MNILNIMNYDVNNVIGLDFDDLDFGFGIGDYYYDGKCNGCQIGFYWNEELGEYYVEHIFLTIYVGNEDDNDLMTLNRTLKNLTPNDKLSIKLSNEDYKIFKKWYNETNRDDFHYYTKEEIVELESEVK